MNLSRYLLIALLFAIATPLVKAQVGGRVFQLSGLIVNKASQDPVSFARISVNKSRRGAFANAEGFYSIPVLVTDTIYFSSLGYRPARLVVRDYLDTYKGDRDSPYIYAISYLNEDSIVLPDLVIFPYNNAAELRTALIETKVPENIENVNARDNLNPETLDILIETMRVDEGERIMVARQLYYNEYQQRNVAPTATLFDPIAIYQLLNYINTKTKERKDKDLNYWSD